MKNLNHKSDPRRLGRPPKPPDEVRSERVVSFVTRGEFDRLLEYADDCGVSVSAAVHRILHSALMKQTVEKSG